MKNTNKCWVIKTCLVYFVVQTERSGVETKMYYERTALFLAVQPLPKGVPKLVRQLV